jgi:hypothetical protein
VKARIQDVTGRSGIGEWAAETETEDLFEVANLYPDTTGLPMTVWISPCGDARHDVRVKVNMTLGNQISIANTAVVGVRPTPRVISGQLSLGDAQAVFRWIALNTDALVPYWEGCIDTASVIWGVKPLAPAPCGKPIPYEFPRNTRPRAPKRIAVAVTVVSVARCRPRLERDGSSSFTGAAHQRPDVLTTVSHTQNQHVLAVDAIDEDVAVGGKAPASRAKVVARPPGARISGQKKEALDDGVNLPVGDLGAAALLARILPDTV